MFTDQRENMSYESKSKNGGKERRGREKAEIGRERGKWKKEREGGRDLLE